MHLLTLVFPMFTCALAGASLGCTVTTSTEPPVVVTPSTGTFTLRWTVANSNDPSVCSAFAASRLELVVYDAGGNHAATVNAPCETYAVSISLPEGTYSADATLVDSAGNARSTTKPLQAIEVVGGTDLAIDLDFPPSSIL